MLQPLAELPVAVLGPALATVVVMVAAAIYLGGGSAAARAIPNPFPVWSDLVWEVTRTGGFPDMVKLHAAHGPVFWWRFLGRRVLMVGGYEACTQLLKGEHSIVEAEYPPSVKHMLGRWGMVNVAGKQHLRVKRLIQPAFTPKAIRGYLPRMQATAEEAVAKWAAAGDILFYEEAKWYTFRVAVDLLVGFDKDWTSAEGFPVVNGLFKTWLEGLFSFPVRIPGTAFARGMQARAGLLRRIDASLDLLERRRAAAAGGSGEAEQEEQLELTALMDQLLSSRDEQGQGLTREQLGDNILTILFAGHDTSATSLTRIVQHLHAHPEAAQRLREEQAAVLAKHGPAITEAALEDMPFADGVIREALRITPIIAGFPRIALEDFELGGFTVTKGTRMQCSLAQTLLTDSRWAAEAEPLAFKPERWMGGAAQKAGAWIPFGGGSRLCLGWLLAMAEMKVLLAAMFRAHRLELKDPEEPWLLFPLARPARSMPACFVAAA